MVTLRCSDSGVGSGEHGALGQGDERAEVVSRVVELDAGPLDTDDPTAQQVTGAERGSEVAGREGGRRRVADDDLAGAGRTLGRLGRGRRRPGDHQLPVRAPDEEEVERAGVHAGGHPQRHPSSLGREPADLVQRSAHLQRCCGSTKGVTAAREEQKERVAPELEEGRAVGVGIGEQAAEAGPDELGDVLGADPTQAPQSLGHGREPGDVDEHDGALDAAMQLVGGRRIEPLAHDARHVGRQRSRRGFGHQLACSRMRRD